MNFVYFYQKIHFNKISYEGKHCEKIKPRDLYCRCIADALNNYATHKPICNKIVEENIHGANVYFIVCLERRYT